MTASPQPNRKTPFRVVPPQKLPVNSISIPNKPTSTNVTAEQALEAQTPPRKFPLKLALIASGLTLVGFIRVPYQVGGDVTLEWPEGARQSVRAPAPAIIEEFYVEPGDEVRVDQPLVKLSSRELDSEIAGMRERLARAHEQLQEAQRDQVQAEARLVETLAQAEAVQVRATRLSNRLENLEQGILPPDIEALIIQQDRIEGQLTKARTDWERHQTLYDQGAISLVDVEAREQNFHNLQRDLNTKQQEIQLAQQRLSDLVIDEQDNANFQQSNVIAANQVAQATERIDTHENTIAVLEQRLQDLQQQETELILKSTQSGTILDRDLDLRLGEAVTPDDTLLRIADLNQLTAEVQVKQEDKDFVQPGADVTFRPDSDKLAAYDATVVKIVPNLEADQTQQRRVAIVQVMIENPEGNLLPNSSGYAKIFSQWMPLYQRIGREVIKLWPSKFL